MRILGSKYRNWERTEGNKPYPTIEIDFINEVVYLRVHFGMNPETQNLSASKVI